MPTIDWTLLKSQFWGEYKKTYSRNSLKYQWFMVQVDAVTKDLYTALHIAAKEGQEEVIVHTKKRRGGRQTGPYK